MTFGGWGKYYESAFTGSLMGKGSGIFAVWGYAIATARPPQGEVELNPELVSVLIGMPSQEVQTAIEFLTSPDQRSRSKAEEGKRLIHIGGFLYRIVNWSHYRAGRAPEERREQNRQAQQRFREKQKSTHTTPAPVPAPVPAPSPAPASQTQKRPERHVELPAGFPQTLEEALSICSMIGVPAEFATPVYHKVVGVGGLDGAKRPIMNFRSWMKGRYADFENEQAEKKLRAQPESKEIQQRIDVPKI